MKHLAHILLLGLLLSQATSCTTKPSEDTQSVDSFMEEQEPQKNFEENREACLDRNPLKNLYFGDLHVHTKFSFDAWAYDVRVSPADAYEYAKGNPVFLPPLDSNGKGTRISQLQRPLDFAAVTDHAELLAETSLCADPGSEASATDRCTSYNKGGGSAVDALALVLGSDDPVRWEEICGEDGSLCATVGLDIWSQIREATEEAYDRTNACSFTAFHGYEYTSAREISNQHRNVIFRGEETTTTPVTLFDAPTPEELWSILDESCIQANGGCDVITIPHNANWSNGNMFIPTANLIDGEDAQARLAELRGRMEPLIEMFQHKGDAECRNDFEAVQGDDDPDCNFEKMRKDSFQDCGEGVGAAAMIGLGCISRRDFARTAVIDGLHEETKHGSNPWKLGFIGGTDTHNGIPGMVEESAQFPGHVGIDDDEPLELLGFGNLIPGGVLANPGGLVAVWAEENSREALFASMRSREVYATSGTRITLRFFGGWDYPASLCDDPEQLTKAYESGVPMGSDLTSPSGTSPRFFVSAMADPGTSEYPGSPLHRIQIIKGWVDEQGIPHQRVVDVIGGDSPPDSIDESTCEVSSQGSMSLCTVWTDPEFDPSLKAIYYARVLEQPSCRYHTYLCNEIPEEERPLSCSAENVPRTIQERAWSSPIWYGGQP